jgi:hypothetical protein
MYFSYPCAEPDPSPSHPSCTSARKCVAPPPALAGESGRTAGHLSTVHLPRAAGLSLAAPAVHLPRAGRPSQERAAPIFVRARYVVPPWFLPLSTATALVLRSVAVLVRRSGALVRCAAAMVRGAVALQVRGTATLQVRGHTRACHTKSGWEDGLNEPND